jgi:hypothetical protein
MSNNPVNVEELGSGIGTKRAAAAIEFGAAVERRGAKTVGKHMERLIDDCQVAWTAIAEVTAALESAGVGVNPKNAKLMIGDAFDDGLISYRNFAAMNLSEYKNIGFWIMADRTLAAGVLQLVLDETLACANAVEKMDIPALVAGMQRYIRVPFTRDNATMAATISVGILATSDPGVTTLYLDDIRAGSEFLGVADEMQDKDAYAQYDPVHIIDQGKAEVSLAGTALTGQYLEPVGNGKFAVSTPGAVGAGGFKTLDSRAVAVEDQPIANGKVPARMV